GHGGNRPVERRRTTPGRDPYPAASHSWSACCWPWHFSELSSGRSKLEPLFLDEGFGTLDCETLDAALNALESLRLSGRTIGVISHIDQLTRRIPVRIDVKRTGVGTSTIHVKG
ncbi:MAG: hypothetical protein K8R07_05995, partial [Desulfobacterales bacterium]|nr:hypothetical protein [Desulfobacterales bacterium]